MLRLQLTPNLGNGKAPARQGSNDNQRMTADAPGVLIAEDDVLLREGLARLLADEGFDVIDQADAEARDANALSDAVDLAPGVRVQQLGGPGAFTTIQIGRAV